MFSPHAWMRRHFLLSSRPDPRLHLRLSSNPSYSYGGEVILGGTDSQFYSGEILWAPVVQEYYWKIGIEE